MVGVLFLGHRDGAATRSATDTGAFGNRWADTADVTLKKLLSLNRVSRTVFRTGNIMSDLNAPDLS